MNERALKSLENKGRVALITGSAKRVGREVCIALADNGYSVAIHYRESGKEAEELANLITAKHGATSAKIFKADLANESEIADLPHKVYREFGRLDLLINNASVFHKTPLDQLNGRVMSEFGQVHVMSPAMLSIQSARYLRLGKPGRIINMVDVYARFAKKDYLAYTVSKAGLEALTRQLAVELAPEILVNAIAPGAILEPVEGFKPEAKEKILSRIPLGKFGNTQDIVDAVLFLADVGYVTGQTITVDGGRSLTI